MTIGRIKYEKPINYNKNVRIGTWVEEHYSYEKKCLNHVSSYSVDYAPKQYSARNTNHIFNNKFNGEGLHARIISDHEGSKYLENFSSLYDLSYNHFPKCLKYPVKRTHIPSKGVHQPEIDYTLNYGNLTNYGLLESKKNEWICNNYKGTNNTHYLDHYAPPTPESYPKKRYACPKQNSTKIWKPNKDLHHLNLRDQKNAYLPEPEHTVVTPQRPSCNPLTWKCSKEMEGFHYRCFESKSHKILQQKKLDRIPYSCIMQKIK